MHFLNASALSAVDSASQTGSPLDANQWVSASFHAYFGDATAAGTVKLQASNDINTTQYNSQNFQPTNWVDVPSQSATIAAGASALLTIPNCSYRWLRVVYTRSAGGSTTINVNVMALYP